MKYKISIDIDLPVERVIELFDNPENMKEWQPGLISFEPVSGTPGQPGAKSKLRYIMGNKEVEMIETILTRDLPKEFSGTYEAQGVYNKIVNNFIPLSESKTRWEAENEFRFAGMMKVIAFLMPGAFKKQSMKYLELFKEFAENA